MITWPTSSSVDSKTPFFRPYGHQQLVSNIGGQNCSLSKAGKMRTLVEFAGGGSLPLEHICIIYFWSEVPRWADWDLINEISPAVDSARTQAFAAMKCTPWPPMEVSARCSMLTVSGAREDQMWGSALLSLSKTSPAFPHVCHVIPLSFSELRDWLRKAVRRREKQLGRFLYILTSGVCWHHRLMKTVPHSFAPGGDMS